ncbi:MAG: F0F1 ATP synthase subunit B' [Nostocaceae cyanobacterium]|nr:F0F1 ATP synthase subunit B' [Nostocaceae cyanobacterium]
MIIEPTATANHRRPMFDFDATLPLMALQFLLLSALLNAIFYKPLTKVLDDRDNYIRTNHLEAGERLAKAERLTKDYQLQLASARKQAQEIVADAQAEAQKISAEKIAQAQQEAQAQREQAASEIEQQKQEALRSLSGQVDALSRQILEKLLGPALVK